MFLPSSHKAFQVDENPIAQHNPAEKLPTSVYLFQVNPLCCRSRFLFLGLTPMKFQHAIQSLSPLRVAYSRRRSEWESSVQCLLVNTMKTKELQDVSSTSGMERIKYIHIHIYVYSK